MSHRQDIKISPGAVVCDESKLRGDITIGQFTVVHPRATIIAEAGPIVIGENCLIEEQAKIIHRLPIEHQNSDKAPVLLIGSNNVFEVDCTCEAQKIGDNNVFESKCYVGNRVTINNGTIIGAGCRLTAEQNVKDNMIYYGSECHQREAMDKPPAQTLQLDFLSKVLPNYHHLRRPNRHK